MDIKVFGKIIRIDFFKSKEWRDARDKYEKQKAEMEKFVLMAKAQQQIKKHQEFINRVRGGHLVHLAKLKQITKKRKKFPAPVRHIGSIDDITGETAYAV